jgi:hypothetical protein
MTERKFGDVERELEETLSRLKTTTDRSIGNHSFEECGSCFQKQIVLLRTQQSRVPEWPDLSMPKKSKFGTKPKSDQQGIWIRPNFTLRGKDGSRAWERAPNLQSQSRFLELADVALGVKKNSLSRMRLPDGGPDIDEDAAA